MKDNIQTFLEKPGVLFNSKYQNYASFNNESKKDSSKIKFSICITDSTMKKKADMLKSVKDTDYINLSPKAASHDVQTDKAAKLTIVNEIKHNNKKFSISQNRVVMTPMDQGVKSVPKMEEDPESICFVIVGDEVNLLQKYIQKVTKEMQRLLNKVAQNLGEICTDGISIVLTADVKNASIANSVQCDPEKHYVTIERPLSYERQSPPSPDTDIIPYRTKCKPIKQQIKITVNKFESVSDNFFKVLSVLYAVFQLIGNSTCNAPGLYIRNWHFHNMAQGFLLRIYLKKAHVNTLNIMRNLYFVIITTDTPNLAIEINFDLKNGSFSLYDYELFEWIGMHDNIFEKTLSTDKAVLKINSDIDCYKYQPLKKESKVHNVSWVHNLDVESVFTNLTRSSSFIITETKSMATSVDDRLRSFQAYATVATSCSTFHIGYSNICNLFNPKYWTMKVFTFLRMIKNFNRSLVSCDFIDESIFEKTSVDTYILKDVVTTQNSIIVLKCLAHSFGCAVFSFLLSII